MRSDDAVIGFVIVAVVQFSDDRKVGEMNVVAGEFEPHPPVRAGRRVWRSPTKVVCHMPAPWIVTSEGTMMSPVSL